MELKTSVKCALAAAESGRPFCEAHARNLPFSGSPRAAPLATADARAREPRPAAGTC